MPGRAPNTTWWCGLHVGGVTAGSRRTHATPQRRTADFDGRLQLQQDRLAHEHLTGCLAQPLDFALSQVHLLAGSSGLDIQQLVDDGIDIELRRHGCCGADLRYSHTSPAVLTRSARRGRAPGHCTAQATSECVTTRLVSTPPPWLPLSPCAVPQPAPHSYLDTCKHDSVPAYVQWRCAEEREGVTAGRGVVPDCASTTAALLVRFCGGMTARQRSG